MTIVLTPNSNIDNIIINNPTINTFYFPDGNYYITNILKINKSNISFLGMSKTPASVHIYQSNNNCDGLSVYATNNFSMKFISLHVTGYGKIALTMAGVNKTNVSNCYFYGNPSSTFTIYYAGPNTLIEGQPTLDAYNNGQMDSNNVFTKNVIYAMWSGDTVSYSLQINGKFTNNIIRGGKLAAYMCKNTIITNNVISDSTTNGIFVSLPSHNLTITHNKIMESTNSGIIIKNQQEHGIFPISNYNMIITNNSIYNSKSNGIEMNDCQTIEIANNQLVETVAYGIYALNCNNVNIHDNSIYHFTEGFWFENSNNNIINHNEIIRFYPEVANNVCKYVNANNNIFSNNTIRGQITNTLLYSQYNSSNNTFSNNNYNQFTEYDDDHLYLQIM